MEETVRLNKYLAHCGVCSRRDADKLIEEGKVSVNGRRAQPGQLVSGRDDIMVSGKRISNVGETVVLAFYKPVGVTCTERDAHAQKMISDVIKYPVRVTYAGRLDRDSEGLLLLTNDGDLIQEMMRGSGSHEKEYTVKVDKEITPDFLRKMAGGVYLKSLSLTTKPCEIKKTGKFTFEIILTQGVNRQIRRMCAACGYQVKSLKRTRVLQVTLGDLKPGEYYELSREEVQRLYMDCGGDTKCSLKK